MRRILLVAALLAGRRVGLQGAHHVGFLALREVQVLQLRRQPLLARVAVHQPLQLRRRQLTRGDLLRQHVGEEGVGHLPRELPRSVRAESRGSPDGSIHVHAHTPAKAQVIVPLCPQQPLPADGGQDVQQQRPPQLRGGHRRPAGRRGQPVKRRRQLLEHRLDQHPKRAQRMVLG